MAKHKKANSGAPTHGSRLLRHWFDERPDVAKNVVAADLGMSKQNLGHILKDRQRPTLDQAMAIHSMCGVDPGEWLHTPRKVA